MNALIAFTMIAFRILMSHLYDKSKLLQYVKGNKQMNDGDFSLKMSIYLNC